MQHFDISTIRKLRMPTTETSAFRKTRMILGCGLTVAFCSWSAAEDYRLMVKAGKQYSEVKDFDNNLIRMGLRNSDRRVLTRDNMCDEYIDLQRNFRDIVKTLQEYGIYPFELVDYETFCKSLYDGGRLPRFRKEATLHYSMYASALLNYSEGSLSEVDLVNMFVKVDFLTGRKRPIKPFEFRQFLADLEMAIDEIWLIYAVRTGNI